LVIVGKLVSLSLHRRRTDYEPDRGECVGCARCFEFCPNELARR
jgi:formate hydrogenlyase subunit 6/NADH:ubiquinone oxidoreductase subunit I